MLKSFNRRVLAAAATAAVAASSLALPALAADKKAPAAGDAKSAAALPAPEAVKPVDETKLPDVVATVNGTAIKKGDLQNAVESIQAQMKMMGTTVPPERKDEMYRSLLDDLISTELLAQEAKTRAVAVSDKDVDDFVSQFKDRFPSEQVFQNALKEQGISETQLRSDVRKQLGIKKLLDKEVMSKVSIPDKEARKFYDENPDKFQEPETVHAAHVLIAVDKDADDKTRAEKKKEAEKVLADAKAGKDFAELAKEHSGDPGSKDKGGDLGFFGHGEMVKSFEDAAFALKKPGDLSGVVESPYGYHVIKLIEKKPGRKVPFDEVKKDVSDFLKEKKAGDLAKTYVDGLRKKAQVKIFI